MLYLLLIIPVVAIALWLLLSVRPRIQEKKRQQRLALFNQLKPEVEKAFEEIKSLYNFSHYITETERMSLLEDYRELDSKVKPLLHSKELEEFMYKDVFRRFHSAMTDTMEHKKSNNSHFIENQLSSCSEYFDTVLTYPLDSQQREAVVSLEDNVLVISSAGSGKTMTTVGKVRYLIDKQHVPAEKILLITFTRKAAQSLSERLGEKKLKCRTFHKLALDIIGEATGE